VVRVLADERSGPQRLVVNFLDGPYDIAEEMDFSDFSLSGAVLSTPLLKKKQISTESCPFCLTLVTAAADHNILMSPSVFFERSPGDSA